MKKLCLIVCLVWSMQSVAQTTQPQATGLIFPNSTANMIVELLRGITNHVIAELKKAEERKIRLATIIEENFEGEL
tara:strand:+ start:747 stop:974 length:228 start_codon:yes stop_codon:yes gene_type:complete